MFRNTLFYLSSKKKDDFSIAFKNWVVKCTIERVTQKWNSVTGQLYLH